MFDEVHVQFFPQSAKVKYMRSPFFAYFFQGCRVPSRLFFGYGTLLKRPFFCMFLLGAVTLPYKLLYRLPIHAQGLDMNPLDTALRWSIFRPPVSLIHVRGIGK